MSKSTLSTINIGSKIAVNELEELEGQLYSIRQNLILVQNGIEANGYPELAVALSPSLLSLESARQKAEKILNVLDV